MQSMNRESDSSGPIRVVLADDYELVRSGIKALLSRIEGVAVIAEAGDGHELLARIDSEQPDVVMTDIDTPAMDGIEAISHIARRHPRVRLDVLSMRDTLLAQGKSQRKSHSSWTCVRRRSTCIAPGSCAGWTRRISRA